VRPAHPRTAVDSQLCSTLLFSLALFIRLKCGISGVSQSFGVLCQTPSWRRHRTEAAAIAHDRRQDSCRTTRVKTQLHLQVPAMGPGEKLEVDPDVGAVVVGFDRHINYYKIHYATVCLRELPGCQFIATNLDAVTHLTDAQEWAGNGSMVRCFFLLFLNTLSIAIEGQCAWDHVASSMHDWGALITLHELHAQVKGIVRGASHYNMLSVTRLHRFAHVIVLQVGAIKGSSQREPKVVGKPAGFMLKDIAAKFNLKPEQICMVGDRLDTDMMFGKNGGLTTLLVLSGVTTEAELLSEGNSVHPDYYTDQLPDLLTCKSA
jgi:ribonucleotide monophosphatase NagD (HAD superfamily)